MRRNRANFALLVSLTLAAVLTGCGRHAEREVSAAAAARAVTTLTVSRTSTTVAAEVPGTVHAIREANLAPKIMSRIAAVLVREGDRVHQGQVLVRLENRDLAAGVAQSGAAVAAAQAGAAQARTNLQMQRVTSSADVAQAEASLRAAQANLAKARQGPRPEQRQQAAEAVRTARAGVESARARLSLLQEGARKQERAQVAASVSRAQQGVEAAQAAVTAAQAGLRTAEADYNRIRNLVAQDVVARQQLDHATAAYESAKAQVTQAQAGERQARAALEQAREQESLVREGPRTQEIQQAEQAVASSEAGLKQAQLELEMATRGGRAEDVAAAAAAVSQAEQALRNARAAQGRDRLREEEVRAADAAVGQARAGRRSAGVMLGYSTLTAPFSGVITSRLADPGSMGSPGVPILVLADDSEYRLEASVPEKLASGLYVGAPVKVALDSLRAQWDARLVQMVPAADPASHSMVVKARLPRDDRLHPGLFGRLILDTGRRQTIVIPERAVWREGSLTGVFVVSDGLARLRMVQLGSSSDGTVEVNAGLSPGDVIAADSTGLTDNTPVQPAGAVQP